MLERQPIIEIVAIGDEILKGFIINTNGAEISKALFEQNYLCHRHTVLQDEEHSLKDGLSECLNRSQIVITTGGLGPTTDDTSRQCAAKLFDSPFAFNEEIANELKRRYGDLPISLIDQATVPTKAIIMKNPIGTASGLIFHNKKNTLILMPGVPLEMRVMLNEQVIPYLKTHFPMTRNISSQSAHFFMLSESTVDPIIRKLQNKYPDVTFGIYPSQGSLSVYATSAKDQVPAAIKELSDHFNENVLPTRKIEEAVQHLFIKNSWTLSIAESCTGGAIAAKLTKLPGASSYFLGGIVSYSNRLKTSVLEVPQKTLETYGAVSKETAEAMVIGCLKATGSTFAIAVTGIAGPDGGTVDKPVGTVWISLGRQGALPISKKLNMRGNREMNIERSVYASLGELLNFCR